MPPRQGGSGSPAAEGASGCMGWNLTVVSTGRNKRGSRSGLRIGWSE